MRSGDRMHVGEKVPASDTKTRTEPIFRRVLVAVEDASQVKQVVQLARGAGASEARVLHLNLRESIGGRRYALESDSAAAYAVEAIVADATDWGANLIVLGAPRRGELATRLLGSVTLRVLLRAPCPVLVASSADKDRLTGVAEEGYVGARS